MFLEHSLQGTLRRCVERNVLYFRLHNTAAEEEERKEAHLREVEGKLASFFPTVDQGSVALAA